MRETPAVDSILYYSLTGIPAMQTQDWRHLDAVGNVIGDVDDITARTIAGRG
jgi:hypothetical protein